MLTDPAGLEDTFCSLAVSSVQLSGRERVGATQKDSRLILYDNGGNEVGLAAQAADKTIISGSALERGGRHPALSR